MPTVAGDVDGKIFNVSVPSPFISDKRKGFIPLRKIIINDHNWIKRYFSFIDMDDLCLNVAL